MTQEMRNVLSGSAKDFEQPDKLPAGFNVYMTNIPDARIAIKPGIALSPNGHSRTKVVARIIPGGDEFNAKIAFSTKDFKNAGQLFEGLEDIQDSGQSKSHFYFDVENDREFTSNIIELATRIDVVLRVVYQHKLC